MFAGSCKSQQPGKIQVGGEQFKGHFEVPETKHQTIGR